MREFVLASASPRRKELLSQIGIGFRIDVSKADENTESLEPGEIVKDLSYGKAMEVYNRQSDDVIVIGADTIVYANGMVLGKPKDRQDAYEMIHMLQGALHQVYTGVTLVWREDGKVRHESFYEKTEVEIYPMSDSEINQYVSMNEPYDKAGGYAVQGYFARYVKGINGDYNNVVGLPVGRLYQELNSLNLLS